MQKGFTSINGYKQLPFGPLMLAGFLAGIGSTAANLLLAAIASAIFTVPDDFRPFSIFPILAACVGASLGATGIYSLFDKISKRPMLLFNRTALVGLVFSFILPASLVRPSTLYLPAIGWQVAGTLMLMHIIAALIIVRSVNRLPHPD
jgi:protein-S-isoprenylcysteine O-methyltransferase Ste14